MRRTATIFALAAAVLLVAPPSSAGSWFGLRIGGNGIGVSLGFSTWEPYTNAWYDPSWSLNFETALSPYGQWITVDGLGRVWHPTVASSWRPYTYGRWVWTSYGWTWVAYEPWGYIPHHFGRWALCGRGWVWVPGYTYTPASVVWLSGGSFVGWYAAPPSGWHNAWWRGLRSGYGDGYRDGWRDARYATWVAWNDFTADNMARRARRWSELETKLPRSATRPLSASPSRSRIQRATGRAVPMAEVSVRTIKVGSRNVRIARPEGIRTSIERYAGDTVSRGLDRQLAARIGERARSAERSVPKTAAVTRSVTRTTTSSRTISRTATTSSSRSIPRVSNPPSTRSTTRNRTLVTGSPPTVRHTQSRTLSRSQPATHQTTRTSSTTSSRAIRPFVQRSSTNRTVNSSRSVTRSLAASSSRSVSRSVTPSRTVSRAASTSSASRTVSRRSSSTPRTSVSRQNRTLTRTSARSTTTRSQRVSRAGASKKRPHR